MQESDLFVDIINRIKRKHQKYDEMSLTKNGIHITSCHKIGGTGTWWAPNSQLEIMLIVFFLLSFFPA
jgi:hypothetical protein